SSAVRRASASSSVRSVCTPAGCPGSVRAANPVATTIASACSDAPSASSTSPVRNATARMPRWVRTPKSSRPSTERSVVRSGAHSPVSTCFESGGGWYGPGCSSPTRLTRPWKPALRSCSTVRRPPSPAPTTRTCSGWLMAPVLPTGSAPGGVWVHPVAEPVQGLRQEPRHVHLRDPDLLRDLGLGHVPEEAQQHDRALTLVQLGEDRAQSLAAVHPGEIGVRRAHQLAHRGAALLRGEHLVQRRAPVGLGGFQPLEHVRERHAE